MFAAQNSYLAIGISETWLAPDIEDELFSIPNYTLIRNDRISRGGGVALYIKTFLYKSCSVLSIPTEEVYDIEYLIVKLSIGNQICAIGVFYKHSNHYSNVGILADVINYLIENNIYNFILMGDFNINMLENGPATIYLNNLLQVFDCKQLITDPTRVTSEGESLLDLIITNSDLHVKHVEVLDLCFSDHNVTECDIEINSMDNKPIVKEFRSYKNFNMAAFNEDASRIDWNFIYDIDSIQEKVEFFNANLINLFNRHAPVKKYMFKPDVKGEPWFTDTLKEIKKIKNNAWRRYKRSKNAAHRQFYCDIRNYYNTAIKQERRVFYSHNINSSKNNPKQLWTKLKSWGVVRDNTSQNLPEEICNATSINDYFIDSIPNLSSDEVHINSYLESQFKENLQFTFIPVTINKIEEIIIKQKPHTIGSDEISAKMLQLSLMWISAPLTHIINVSFERGQLPNQWKISCVKPIPKKKNPDQYKDLRPITMLSVPLKIAESAMYEQLSKYAIENAIISPNQSGFRKGFSTSTLLSSVTDEILRGMDNTQVTSLTLLDMSKAFDSIDINCLIAKLHYYGVSGNSLSWFKNYLYGRQQFTKVNSYSSILVSQYRSVGSGVPQGSILGPLLFNIFTSDLTRVLLNSKLNLYADDIQILYSFVLSDSYMASQLINNDLNVINDWTVKNTLLINPNKSQNIVLGTSYQLRNLEEFNVQICNENIPSCTVVKNLGVSFDSTLSFSSHVTNICKKAFCNLKQLHSFKKYLDTDTKILLSETLVLSHLNYADVVYGPCLSQYDKCRLQKIQNSCVRYFTTVPYTSHITPYLRSFNLLNMSERRFIHIVGFILNILNNNNPAYLSNKIKWRNEIHSRHLRQVENRICIPPHKTESFKATFSYMAAYVLNNLPAQYRTFSIATVKRNLKKDLLSSRLNCFNMEMF